MDWATTVFRPVSNGLVRYDVDSARLLIAKPWGLLCLRAKPLSASRLDLRQSTWWTSLPAPRLDCRIPLQLIRELESKRRWDERIGDYTSVPTEPLDPATADTARAWRAFFQEIGGVEFCQLAARFHPRLQYSALRYATCNERVAALAHGNPGLFVGIVLRANSWKCHSQATNVRLLKLVEGKQRDIARRLGFLPDASRVLARMEPRGLTANRWKKFRRAWNRSRPVRAVSRHLPELRPLTLDLLSLSHCWDVFDRRVFHQLAGSTWGHHSIMMPRLICWLIRVLDEKSGHGRPDRLRIHNLTQLQQTIETVTSYLPSDYFVAPHPLPFPSPPVPGEPGYIEPIRTLADLCRETVFMQNCSLSYADEVAAGLAYFFRALPRFGMQRCTVVLRPTELNGRKIWQVTETRAKNNSLCSTATKEALHCFFEQQQFVSRDRNPREYESSQSFE